MIAFFPFRVISRPIIYSQPNVRSQITPGVGHAACVSIRSAGRSGVICTALFGLFLCLLDMCRNLFAQGFGNSFHICLAADGSCFHPDSVVHVLIRLLPQRAERCHLVIEVGASGAASQSFRIVRPPLRRGSKSSPERLPRRAVRGLGAHSPQQIAAGATGSKQAPFWQGRK